MTIKSLSAMIHQNAVDHGWWEGARKLLEIIALIHSEWSEALEEARAGRPMIYKLFVSDDDVRFVTPSDANYTATKAKPEGIAVELIDGVIRILDLFGHVNVECSDPITGMPTAIESMWGESSIDIDPPEDVPTLVAYLHAITSEVIVNEDCDPTPLLGAMSLALLWVNKQGIDPLALLMEKHEYNKGRPYKHGKKF